VQQVTIAPSHIDPEIIIFTQIGATSGVIYFRILRRDSNLVVTYDVTVSLPWNASAATFTNMLSNFDIYYGYSPAVILTKFDAAGNNISASPSNGYKYVWTVTLNYFRPQSLSSQTFILNNNTLANTNVAITPTITEVHSQAHSPQLSGTFTLSLDNILVSFYNSTSHATQVDLPFNTAPGDLGTWIAQSWNCSYVEVDLNVAARYPDGFTYIISWVGCSGSKSLIFADGTNLVGGTVGTNPTIQVWRTRAASTNLLVEPISAEYLFGAASAP
jgi:hypothetical protein